MNKVVILNAPSQSGKDSAADYVEMLHPKFEKKSFKEPIYEIGAAIYNITYETMVMLCTDRNRKEVPHEVFGGLTPRQTLIYVSENVIKPNFGNNYFGKRLVSTFIDKKLYICSDGGFKEEIQGVIEKVGVENVLIIRIHRSGFTFKNDSRSYLDEKMITLPPPLAIDVYNNEDEQSFKDKIYDICFRFNQGELV